MIHREGNRVIIFILVVLTALNLLIGFTAGNPLAWYISGTISVIFVLFILRFFRKPRRNKNSDENLILAPADGTIVAIEETEEQEFLHKKMIQVSIFMSVWNVHINWFPVKGRIIYYRYHPGKYLVARHPKSSVLNERNTTVIETGNGEQILLRQIAGYVARRVISYAREGLTVEPGDEMGFIKFGSRVDIFLPTDAKIHVRTGVKVKGKQDGIASFA